MRFLYFIFCLGTLSCAAQNLLKNGDFSIESASVPYRDRLQEKGFILPETWVSGWLLDTGSAPASVARSGQRVEFNAAKGDTLWYSGTELVPGSYKLTVRYQLAPGARIKAITYRYGDNWKWMGTRTLKEFDSGNSAEFKFAEETGKLFRVGFAVQGKVAFSSVSLEKSDAPGVMAFDMGQDWKIEFIDGAEGKYAIDKTVLYQGKPSLKITKSNGLGYIRLTSRRPMELEDKGKYSYRVWYHSANAGILSQLLLRIAPPEAENLPMPYGLFNYMAYNHIINSAPGEWNKRLLNFECALSPSRDVNLQRKYAVGPHACLLLHGNPCDVWLGAAEVYPARTANSTNRQTYKDNFTDAEVLEKLKNRRKTPLKLTDMNGLNKLLENGKLAAPVMYMSSENNELVGDFAGFSRAGINLQIVPILLTDHKNFANSIWKSEREFDFTAIDRQVMTILRKNPEARLIILLSINPYREWSEENPDECWMNADKKRYYVLPGTSMRPAGASNDIHEVKAAGGFWMVSYHSPKWRESSNLALKTVAEHIRKAPYGKAVSGFFFFSGIDGRLQPGTNDYSPAAIRAFIQDCRRKYGSVEAMAAAWQRPVKSFDEIKDMNFEGYASILGRGIKDIYTDRQFAVDFKRFHFENIWKLTDSWAKTVKDLWDYDIIACVYRDFDRGFLDTEHLDICGNDLFYPLRLPGYATSLWYPSRTTGKRKMWFMDLDMRSYAGPQVANEEYEQFVGAVLTPESWRHAHNKLVGLCLAGDIGYWYYDMLAYFQDREIMGEIERTRKIAEELARRPSIGNPAETAVVISGRSKFHSKVLLNSYNGTLSFVGVNYIQGMALATSGVPHDFIFLEDLVANPELANYKMLIFSNIVQLNQNEREFIEKHLKKDGRTLIWLYDTGYITNRKDVENITSLTGMKTATEETPVRWTPVRSAEVSPSGFRLEPFISGNEFICFNFRQHGIPYGSLSPGQPFWIEDCDVEKLACYCENGRTAIAFKKFPEWNSVYVAAPSALTGGLLNQLAVKNGVYAFGAPGQQGAMNDRFLSLHALQGGKYEVKLPPGRKILRDAFTGKDVKPELELEVGKTYWYFFE